MAGFETVAKVSIYRKVGVLVKEYQKQMKSKSRVDKDDELRGKHLMNHYK